MAPKEWATQPQLEYLRTMLPKYRDARAGVKEKSLARFWLLLDDGWFSRYPVEAELGIIVSGPGAEPLTPDELKLIGDATTKMKKRLRTWMRWRAKPRAVISKRSTLFQRREEEDSPPPSLGGVPENPPHQDQDREAERVALARDPDTEVTVMTPEEAQAEERKVEDQAVERVRTNRAARMSMLRTTAMELFAAEPEDVRAEVLAQMEEMNGERALGLRDDISGTRVPEEYQHAIDQLPEVVSKVTGAIEEETGWMGLFMAGGPMPNRDGAISIKTFCFGTTPNGADFAASHSNFGEVKGAFGKFLKRAFPHDVRDARGIVSEPEAVTVPGGLIQFESDLDNESDDEGEEASPASAPSKVKPKRVRRKKLAAAVSAAVSPGRRRARPVPTPALSAPATDAVFPIPDFDLTIQDIVTNLNGINGVTTEQEDAAWALGPADGWDGIVPPAEDPEAASPWNGLSLPSTLGEEDVVRARPVPRPMHLGAPFAVDRDVGGSPGRAPRGTVDFTSFSAPDSGSVPASVCRSSATLRVTSATLRISYPTLTTLAATPLEPTPTPSTPDEGPPRSAAALAVWNARQRERARTGDPAPPTNGCFLDSPRGSTLFSRGDLSSLSRGHGQTRRLVAPSGKASQDGGAVVEVERGGGGGGGGGRGGRRCCRLPPPPPPPPSSARNACVSGPGKAAAARVVLVLGGRYRRGAAACVAIGGAAAALQGSGEECCGGGGRAPRASRNPAGGADLVVVTRPQRSRVPARNPDGSPMCARDKKRGGMGGSQLAVPPSPTPNARQAETDAALFGELETGKRQGGCNRLPPSAKKPPLVRSGDTTTPSNTFKVIGKGMIPLVQGVLDFWYGLQTLFEMKFGGEGRDFFDTILKTEKEAWKREVGKGGRAAGKAEQVVSGRRRASLEKGVDEDGTSKGRAGMSRARDKYPRGHAGYKLAAGEKGRWMAPNWYWEAPGSGGGKKRKKGGGGGRERQGVGMSGKEAVQRSRKQRNRRGIPKGRTNNSDKHRSSLPNPGQGNAGGEIAIWGRAGWAVAGGGDPASARAPARGISGDYPNRFSSR
ncbi:hypothetical protein B0H14DRAFT_3762146 [Mycena olivaceomarginata]|nr:hypothetical protein B0H14DRAFT_3762146 [Mycena olivaceomarginata]